MKRGQKGFTLLEMVLVIVLLALLFGISSNILMRGLDAYALVISRQDLLERGELAMDRMGRELSPFNLTSLQPPLNDTTLSFRDTRGNLTSFTLVNGTLTRGAETLITGVAGLDFDYLDGTGALTTIPTNVRRINIELTLTPENNQGNPSTLRQEIYLRNLVYGSFQYL